VLMLDVGFMNFFGVLLLHGFQKAFSVHA
jgi:hypothetical protein